MSKEKEIQNYALCFASAIEDVVRDEDNENYIEAVSYTHLTLPTIA